ncbi:N-acetylmuramoyl-L-alanine amidase [Pseudanabaena sp. PCC 6802]|uniref:N-acetylmuramoyl-L-alanine amidase n=1 Tax=Pseudanabaena sp. PCC 6802 TaxID=118173 RepID=UPI000475CC94|nr:N-acetylmuramoyl-L-alanine amidase [Pseudanabaena sp. PCC 6802]
MRRVLVFLLLFAVTVCVMRSVGAQDRPESLHLTYPPAQHQTTSSKIFFIGTAPKDGDVLINDRPIRRSIFGHFAPSLPLQIGENSFLLRYKDRTITVKVTRSPRQIQPPKELGFISDSLYPTVDIARMPNERICFQAIATPGATLSLRLGDRTIALAPKAANVQLPANSAVLTKSNQPLEEPVAGRYEGCSAFATSAQLGQPEYEISLNGNSVKQKAKGSLEILSSDRLQVAEVNVESGVTRTGPSSDFSRLTPLPKGTRALINAREGEWLRLSYGADRSVWINGKSTKIRDANESPRSIVRSLSSRTRKDWTDIVIPLQVPVPIAIEQSDRIFKLKLHNVTAQTDTILVDNDPIISRLDWHQLDPDTVEYEIGLKSDRQWGYKVRYQGTSLVLSLKHPPQFLVDRKSLSNSQERFRTERVPPPKPLTGVTILLDPGHGSKEDYGARGPTGYPEKDVTLITSKLLRDRLVQMGAKVYLTREGDDDILPEGRVAAIEKIEPAIALSIHYNALPDDGDAENTKGIGTFWYHPQSHDLAQFLHDYLVKNLNRNSYGVYWGNLALVRPTVAPAVLLELGFTIHPEEFEWIIDPQQQKLLADTLANAIAEWFRPSL